MKNSYYFLAVLLFFNLNVNAQAGIGFEDCPADGVPYPYWTYWGCGGGSGCSIICTTAQVHTGDYAGLIPGDGTTNAILDLGNKIFGQWGLEFWMYIPSNKEAYWNLQGQIPVGAGEWIVGNVFFNQNLANPGVGLVDGTALGAINFNFPHDQWFRVVMNWDISLGISLATWQFNVDGVDVVPFGTPFTNNNGDSPTSLGGMDFFSISANNELYVDDFSFVNEFINPFPTPFTDDMENYADGEPISEAYWTNGGCGGGVGCALMASSAQSRSGVLSGLIPGDETTDAVLNLGNKIFGYWELQFWMYIPSGKEGAMNLQNEVPFSTGQPIVGDILFNSNLETPGVGKITDSAMGEVSFNFPHDEWFKVYFEWDISLGASMATWAFRVDGDEVIPAGTPYTNENGDYPTSLGGINFLSYSANTTFYLDDFVYQEPVFSIEDQADKSFKIYPNPAQNILNIDTQETIKSLRIYNVLGNIINEITKLKSIDISNLSSGIYFIKVSTDTGSSIQKFIKN